MLRPYIFLRYFFIRNQKKFCRDFRSDAQALRLTLRGVARTMRGHFE